MNVWQFMISMLGGGLAGGLVSTWLNRIFHWRALRTRFHPHLNNFWGEYVLRIQNSDGRHWETKVGYEPLPKDKKFVEHRTDFVFRLVEFNELKEARELRKKMLTTLNPDHAEKGEIIKTDLTPEYRAVEECLMTVQKKLKLD